MSMRVSKPVVGAGRVGAETRRMGAVISGSGSYSMTGCTGMRGSGAGSAGTGGACWTVFVAWRVCSQPKGSDLVSRTWLQRPSSSLRRSPLRGQGWSIWSSLRRSTCASGRMSASWSTMATPAWLAMRRMAGVGSGTAATGAAPMSWAMRFTAPSSGPSMPPSSPKVMTKWPMSPMQTISTRYTLPDLPRTLRASWTL